MKIKNSHIVAAFALLVASVAYAANQYNWGTSTGGAWNTPDDTLTSVGQALQIGASGGAVAVAGGAPLSLYVRTKAQLLALTPGTTGQIAYCSDCTQTTVAISSGTGIGAWVATSSSTIVKIS